MGKTVERKDELQALAAQQAGYFTAKQAQQVGYHSARHSYHAQAGNWLRVGQGLYRLPGFADTHESDCLRYMLWSRNHADEPQAVISHYSALFLRGLTSQIPTEVYVTVPSAFRKLVPPGVQVFKHQLSAAEIEWREHYRLTTESRTLADCQALKIQAAQNLRAATETVAAEMADPDRGRIVRTPEPVEAEAVLSARKETLMSSNRDSLTRRRRGEAAFTLVELLVVVAIISVLAAMLLPALERSLDYARQSLCANNQKQLMLATLLYAGDYGDFIPEANFVGGWEPDNYWMTHLSPYLTNGTRVNTFSGWGKLDVYKCPIQTARMKAQWNGGNVSLAISFCIARNMHYPTRWRKVAQFSYPAQTMAYSEAGYYSANYACFLDPTWLERSAYYPAYDVGGKYLGGVHSGANNIVWLDTHLSPWRDVRLLTLPPYKQGGTEDMWQRGL